MGGEKGREMTEWSGGGAEGVIIYIYIYIYTYTTYLGSKEISHQKIVYLFVSLFLNTSSSFQLVSFFKAHLTDYFCVRVFNNDCCGSQRCLCCIAVSLFFLKGSRQVVRGEEAKENPP